jgi:acyl-CoA-binding protein
MTLLKIYALYKQASAATSTASARLHRHGRPRQVGRLERAQGQVGDEAMQAYIDLIESLK